MYKRLLIGILCFIMIFPLAGCGDKFVDNGLGLPYSKGTPVHEMDLSVYKGYVNPITTLIGYDRKNTISLPCDINYYTSKSDTEPALVLKAGTEVYIYDKSNGSETGYGLRTWPDYEEEWRYGYAFSLVEFESVAEDAEMYYVHTEELEQIIKEMCKDREAYSIPKNMRRSVVEERILFHIDYLLYDNGAFYSENLK